MIASTQCKSNLGSSGVFFYSVTWSVMNSRSLILGNLRKKSKTEKSYMFKAKHFGRPCMYGALASLYLAQCQQSMNLKAE